MKVAIIDYGSGNLRSAAKAFERAAAEAGLGATIAVTGRPEDVRAADRIVLPGVGAFADCRAGLEAVDGLHDALTEMAIDKARPFFGICVGMQLMATVGREFGDTPGLDWIKGEVTALAPNDPALKIPHMGWNEVNQRMDHPLWSGIDQNSRFYFVHSYYMDPQDTGLVSATTDYGIKELHAMGWHLVIPYDAMQCKFISIRLSTTTKQLR